MQNYQPIDGSKSFQSEQTGKIESGKELQKIEKITSKEDVLFKSDIEMKDIDMEYSIVPETPRLKDPIHVTIETSDEVSQKSVIEKISDPKIKEMLVEGELDENSKLSQTVKQTSKILSLLQKRETEISKGSSLETVDINALGKGDSVEVEKVVKSTAEMGIRYIDQTTQFLEVTKEAALHLYPNDRDEIQKRFAKIVLVLAEIQQLFRTISIKDSEFSAKLSSLMEILNEERYKEQDASFEKAKEAKTWDTLLKIGMTCATIGLSAIGMALSVATTLGTAGLGTPAAVFIILSIASISGAMTGFTIVDTWTGVSGKWMDELVKTLAKELGWSETVVRIVLSVVITIGSMLAVFVTKGAIAKLAAKMVINELAKKSLTATAVTAVGQVGITLATRAGGSKEAVKEFLVACKVDEETAEIIAMVAEMIIVLYLSFRLQYQFTPNAMDYAAKLQFTIRTLSLASTIGQSVTAGGRSFSGVVQGVLAKGKSDLDASIEIKKASREVHQKSIDRLLECIKNWIEDAGDLEAVMKAQLDILKRHKF